MKTSNEKKTRKEFINNLLKGGLFATIFLGTPVSKILGITKNPKIYFKENPNSVKRQK